MTSWSTGTVLGQEIKKGDYLGSQQMEIKTLTPLEIEGVNHCENPRSVVPNDRCGCHSPLARMRQLPRSLAKGPGGQNVVILHHLPYVVTRLQ